VAKYRRGISQIADFFRDRLNDPDITNGMVNNWLANGRYRAGKACGRWIADEEVLDEDLTWIARGLEPSSQADVLALIEALPPEARAELMTRLTEGSNTDVV
jgi:hypothetical protein